MTNEETAREYLEWFSRNYMQLKNKYRKFCKEKDYEWDEDVFSDTYLKIHDAIIKKGLKDTTEQGFDNYTFKSFKMNIKREKQYCRISKRDMNVSSDNINALYEQWFNENKDSSIAKLKSDLFKDFSTLYIMMVVEKNFDHERFHLFNLKMLSPNMTYKRLASITKSQGCRQKVMDVKHFLRENLKKEDIRNAFQEIYGDLV